MLSKELPLSLKMAIEAELLSLERTVEYEIPAEKLIAIYQLIGGSCNPAHQNSWSEHRYRVLPNLTQADRVRVQIALATARKVLPYWERACKETDENFPEEEEQNEEERLKEKKYVEQLADGLFENMSVYTQIPRKFVPTHLLHMAKVALTQNINDVAAFREQAGEWWQIYPRPEQFEREFFIKWAIQEALYEALALTKHWMEPPAQDAVRAYAGIFFGADFDSRQMKWDYLKRNEFWRWWLTEAIPSAWHLEHLD